jgi:hypothetical protein
MFDRDTLWNQVYFALEKEIDDLVKVDYLTDRICDAVSEWVPKQGDFWLTPEGELYVHHGWHEVTPAGVSLEGLQDIANAMKLED